MHTVKATPNPSAKFFELQIESADKLMPAMVRVINTNGAPVETFRNVAIGSVLKFGAGYNSGNYFVEVIQDDERKTVKLIKAN